MSEQTAGKIQIEYSEKAIAAKLALLKLQHNSEFLNKHPNEIAKKFIEYRDEFRAALNFTHKL